MKGAVLAVLCVIALTHGATVHNKNGCPVDPHIHKLLPHSECDRYYRCLVGNLFEMPCPSGLHFSVATSQCEIPAVANCQHNVDTPIDHNVVAGSGKTSQAYATCAAAGSEGALVVHENCNYFYKCNFGLPVAMACPGITLYDPSTELCDWPQNVECGGRPIAENDNGNNEEWDPNTGGNNNDPSQASAICAREGSDHVMIAHENCNQFYQCWAGRPVALTCTGNLLFNPKNDWCDFAANVECGSRLIPENWGSDDQNVNNPNVEEEVPVGNNHYDPSQAPAICAATDSEGVLIAHENCNQFYTCNFGRPVAQICPDTLLFDPTKDRCEWRETVQCENRLIPNPEDIGNGGNEWDPNTGGNNNDPSQAPAICAREGSDHVMIAHENCNQFYQCWAGRPVALTCTGNLLFNPKNDWCDFAANVECGSRLIPENWGTGDQNVNNPNVEEEVPVGNNHYDPSQAPAICAAPNSEGVLIAHENCNQFYTCNFGRPVAQICPGTLLFDPTKDRCEWRETVQCGNRLIPNPEDTGNGGNEWDPNTGGNNNDPSQAPAICAREGSDNIMIAHENCNQFYQCWAGRPVALKCPDNLFFNPKNDWCDFSSNVDCSNRLVK